MKQKQENVNLVRKIAWSFHKSTGIDWDELFLQASYLYYKALQTYDPSKGKISTYAWLLITSELTTFVTNEKKFQEPLDSLDVVIYKPTPSPVPFFDSLSKEAKIVADTILSNASEYDCMSPEEVKQVVANKLKEQGIAMKQIWIGFRDLKLACTY